jgi:hypothetical protein
MRLPPCAFGDVCCGWEPEGVHTVRTFVDRNTMVNEVGRITFRRIDFGATK